MEIKKNGKIINLTEEEIKKIVTKHKINKFLSEDKLSRKIDDKKIKVKSIINKLTTISNMLDSTQTNVEALVTLNDLEEYLEKKIEDFEEKIVKIQQEKNNKTT
jgi:hypothetical protein